MLKPVSRKGYDFSDLSYAVIDACQDVQRQLGVHCMEVDYQRALEIAFSKSGLSWQREVGEFWRETPGSMPFCTYAWAGR